MIDLYHRNKGRVQETGGGLYQVKLQHEHIALNSYSKMRVDLAAQVYYITHFIL